MEKVYIPFSSVAPLIIDGTIDLQSIDDLIVPDYATPHIVHMSLEPKYRWLSYTSLPAIPFMYDLVCINDQWFTHPFVDFSYKLGLFYEGKPLTESDLLALTLGILT